jgi:hypothetical protein
MKNDVQNLVASVMGMPVKAVEAFSYVMQHDPEAAQLFMKDDSSEELVIRYARLLRHVLEGNSTSN